ncbi:MAG: hypothetical protein IPM37_06145 [Hahellaceae bacterium]|nr:hypothetical protein [Hahellaceae bacterium]
MNAFNRVFIILASAAAVSCSLLVYDRLSSQASLVYEQNVILADQQSRIEDLSSRLSLLEHQLSALSDSAPPTPPQTSFEAASENVVVAAESSASVSREEGSRIEESAADDDNLQLDSEVDGEAYWLLAEANYLNDPRDEAWALAQESKIENLLGAGKEYEGIEIRNLDCRSKTCRLELGLHAGVPRHLESVLIGQLGSELPFANFSRNADGLTLFLSRTALDE